MVSLTPTVTAPSSETVTPSTIPRETMSAPNSGSTTARSRAVTSSTVGGDTLGRAVGFTTSILRVTYRYTCRSNDRREEPHRDHPHRQRSHQGQGTAGRRRRRGLGAARRRPPWRLQRVLLRDVLRRRCRHRRREGHVRARSG